VKKSRTMRTPFVAGNWKMNTTVSEARKLVSQMFFHLEEIKGVEKVLCPPFVSLPVIKEMVRGSSIKLGAQNMYFETKGAYTGEISPVMLQELCDFVILGHSERRTYFGESDEVVNKKIKAALAHKLRPILCVGENAEENEAGETDKVINRQVRKALDSIAPPSDNAESIIIAYEPVWAIGTGKAATVDQVVSTVRLIRGILAELWHSEIAENLRVLYGGSVNSRNIAEFVSSPEIDGALVGGASLQPEQFVSIVRQTAEIKARLN